MSGLETAIRNALEKSDRSSAEVRARIYQSSRQALEAGLRKQGIDDPEIVAQQRQRLETLVHAIETEERNRLLSVVEDHVRREAARAPAPPQPAAPSVAAPVRRDEAPDEDVMPVEAEVRGEQPETAHTAAPAPDLDGLRAERGVMAPDARSPRAPAKDAGSLAFKPERSAKARRKKGLVARLFIYFTLLAFIGFGAWWVYSSGLLLTAAQRDTSVPNPPHQVQSEDFNGADAGAQPSLEAGRGFSEAWEEIFNAEKGSNGLQMGSLAVAEPISTPAGKAVRLTSRVAEADGNISIEVPVKVLQEMAGKSSTISLTIQSSSDRQAQISISCDFGSLGDCARHRFTATPERADMLINVNFDRSLAPNRPGRITINSDIDGKGLPINLYSARILPGE